MNTVNEIIKYFKDRDNFAEDNANSLWVLFKDNIEEYKKKRIKLYKENKYFYYELKRYKIKKITSDAVYYKRFFDNGWFALTSNMDKLARFEFEMQE